MRNMNSTGNHQSHRIRSKNAHSLRFQIYDDVVYKQLIIYHIYIWKMEGTRCYSLRMNCRNRNAVQASVTKDGDSALVCECTLPSTSSNRIRICSHARTLQVACTHIFQFVLLMSSACFCQDQNTQHPCSRQCLIKEKVHMFLMQQQMYGSNAMGAASAHRSSTKQAYLRYMSNAQLINPVW
jgi:hypothetical protein